MKHRSIGAALVALTLAACGGSPPPPASHAGLPPGPIACPVAGDAVAAAQILPERLVDQATLQQWQTDMVNLGPRFTGSPAHQQFHE
jgi:hypothetical protein